VYEHGFAWARSQQFYDQTLFWQWMRMPGDIVFSVGTLIMCWDFFIKLRRSSGTRPGQKTGEPVLAPAE
jgi:nitric oxide reductase large subunit